MVQRGITRIGRSGAHYEDDLRMLSAGFRLRGDMDGHAARQVEKSRSLHARARKRNLSNQSCK